MEKLELKFKESTQFQLLNVTPYNFYIHVIGKEKYICSLKGCLFCKEHSKNNRKLRIYKIAFGVLDHEDNKYKLLILDNQSYRRFKATTKREQNKEILIQNIIYGVTSFGVNNLYFKIISINAPTITADLPPIKEYFPTIPKEQQKAILQEVKK